MIDRLHTTTENLQKTVPIFILCIGTFGNILSFIVLARPKTRRFSTAVFLLALTVVDFIAMWSGLLRIILSGYLHIDIRDTSKFMCKMHVYIVYTSTHISSWLIVGVTIERVVCVWMPIKMRLGRDNTVATVAVTAIVLVFCILDIHLPIGFELTPMGTNNETICQPPQNTYGDFIRNIWTWVDMSLLFLLPMVIIVLGNLLILIRVRRSRRLRRESCSERSTQITDTSSLYFLTVLLVSLNVVFLVCVASITIFVIGQYVWFPNANFSEEEIAISYLCWVVVNILVYLNYSVNFIFYLACGQKFREEIKSTFYWKGAATRSNLRVKRSTSSGESIYRVPTTDIVSA